MTKKTPNVILTSNVDGNFVCVNIIHFDVSCFSLIMKIRNVCA